jgi:hypothetical protein
MRIRRGAMGARTLFSLAAALAALVGWSCGVEAPPPVTSPPPLGALAPIDAGGATTCPLVPCQGSSVCKDGTCIVPRPCQETSDCFDGLQENEHELVCLDNNTCGPMPCDGGPCGEGQQCVSGECHCTSNRGCDLGRVCQTNDNNAGRCINVDEEAPVTGCSTSRAGGSGGALLTLASALALAGARARRRVSRRRERNLE